MKFLSSRMSHKAWFSYVADIGELLSVTVDPENSQKILCIDSCEQSSSPTIATYENQALRMFAAITLASQIWHFLANKHTRCTGWLLRLLASKFRIFA